MNKSIITAAAAAVVLVTGVAVSVPVVRNRQASPPPEETSSVQTETFTYRAAPQTTVPVSQTVIQEQSEKPVESTLAPAAVPTTKSRVVTTVAEKPVTTTVQAATTAAQTEKSAENAEVWYVDSLHRNLTALEQKVVSAYSYSTEGDYFYTDDKAADVSESGYNDVISKVAGLAVTCVDRVGIRFDFNNKAWLIQLRKGQYGGVFVGGEIGVFNSADFTTAQIADADFSAYTYAPEADSIKMSMDIYRDENGDGAYNKLFSRAYAGYRWCTGFKWGVLSRESSPVTELVMKSRITFGNTAMAEMFAKGMRQSGFASAASLATLLDDSVYQSGADVYFRWRSVYKQTLTDVEITPGAGEADISLS